MLFPSSFAPPPPQLRGLPLPAAALLRASSCVLALAQLLRNSCATLAQLLRNFCATFAQPLRNLCATFPQLLRTLGSTFAQGLRNFYRLLLTFQKRFKDRYPLQVQVVFSTDKPVSGHNKSKNAKLQKSFKFFGHENFAILEKNRENHELRAIKFQHHRNF